MMDELVIKYYRQLLRGGFPHVGKIENPTVFIDSIGERIQVCGSIARAYMHIYVTIKDGFIERLCYLCTCDPTANVAIEILCTLVEGKPVEEIDKITPDMFIGVLGSTREEFLSRAADMIKLLSQGLKHHRTPAG